jgi:hypothetical protein
MIAESKKIVKRSICVTVISSFLGFINFLLFTQVFQIVAVDGPKDALFSLCVLSFLWTLGLSMFVFDKEVSSNCAVAIVFGFGSLVALLNLILWRMIFSWGFSHLP